MLKSAIGREFGGYKGGTHVMGLDTPVWVARWGETGSTAVVDVWADEYSLYITTKHIFF